MRAHFVEPHEALALLLGVVEGEAVQEGPDELAGDPRQRELEGGVLIHRMVPSPVGQRPDAPPLAIRDLVGTDDARRVAGAGRRDRVVVGSIEPVAKLDLGSVIDQGHPPTPSRIRNSRLDD